MILERRQLESSRSMDGGEEPPVADEQLRALIAEGALREAADLLYDRLERSPGNAAIHRMLADLYLRQGDRRAAQRQLLIAAERFVRNRAEDKAEAVLDTAEQFLHAAADRVQARRLRRLAGATSRHESIVARVERLTRDRSPENRVTGMIVHRYWHELSSTRLLGLVDDAALAALLSEMTVHERIDGSVLMRKGQHRARIYLLVKGGLELVDRDHVGAEYVVDRLRPVTGVGRHAFFHDLGWAAELRTAGARTVTFELDPRGLELASRRSSQPRTLRAALETVCTVG